MPLGSGPVEGKRTIAASRWAGRIARPVGPLAALALHYILAKVAPDLSPAGRSTASAGLWMAIWWMSEAVPLPVTSLLPLILFPLTGVLPIEKAAAPFASKYIFLFLGGFLIALAIERWNLHRRIALVTVLLVGTRPTRLVGGFMLAAAFLSMWISNTATTVMMLPIGLSVIDLLGQREQGSPRKGPDPPRSLSPSALGSCLMLSIAYASSIGGVGTLVGTPPNVFLAGFLAERGVNLGFGQWMLLGVPFVAVFLFVAWFILTRIAFRIGADEDPRARALLREELRKLGPLSRGERTVLVVFVATALAWVVREPLERWDWLAGQIPVMGRIDDTVIALTAAILLFVLPVSSREGTFALDWESARRLPWGVLLLFGGGLSLAEAFIESGLDTWFGSLLQGFSHLPLVLLVLIVTVVVIFLTELTSNIATVSAFLPILGGVALGVEGKSLLLFVPAAIAASCAFMLPVATPPNAIVFGSGHIRIGEMVRVGLWLNLAASILVPLAVYTLGVWAFGVSF